MPPKKDKIFIPPSLPLVKLAENNLLPSDTFYKAVFFFFPFLHITPALLPLLHRYNQHNKWILRNRLFFSQVILPTSTLLKISSLIFVSKEFLPEAFTPMWLTSNEVVDRLIFVFQILPANNVFFLHPRCRRIKSDLDLESWVTKYFTFVFIIRQWQCDRDLSPPAPLCNSSKWMQSHKKTHASLKKGNLWVLRRNAKNWQEHRTHASEIANKGLILDSIVHRNHHLWRVRLVRLIRTGRKWEKHTSSFTANKIPRNKTRRKKPYTNKNV